MIRKGDVLIVPGFGLMDGDFRFYVDRVAPFCVHSSAGLLTRWWPRRAFKGTGKREWTHRDLIPESNQGQRSGSGPA